MVRKFQSFCIALMLASLAGPVMADVVPQQVDASTDDVHRTVGDYQLGAGDKIRVIVFGEDSLSGEFFVAGTGRVSLPLIGEIRAAGLTISQLQQAITAALRDGYLKDPRVSVDVLNYRPFYILGEVEKPGEYPYTNDLTVLNAVATAGGFTYRANKRDVYIRSADQKRERKLELDATTKVMPGDTIRIGERFF